jgi:transcriptional regulator of heat shock response
MTFEATIRFDDDDMNETISRIVKEAIFENSSFASDIAEEIDKDEVAQLVADNTDWDSISDALYENIRENNLDDIAEHLSSDLSDFIMESEEFGNIVVMKVKNAIDETLLNRVEEMSKTINSQAIAISQLTKTIDSMQSKKFWKKLVKK